MEDRRGIVLNDRRANPRGGRRAHDGKKPWYKKQPMWLAAASLLFMGWRRLRNKQ